MFIEKLFGNTFGMVWLIIFLAAVLALMLWIILKKEKEEKIVEINEEVTPVVEEVPVEVKEEVKETVSNDSEYEIIESEDGFFRVRKVGSERTLRKLATRVEAENFIEKRGLKHDWSKANR